jgi:hypothetical protein
LAARANKTRQKVSVAPRLANTKSEHMLKNY